MSDKCCINLVCQVDGINFLFFEHIDENEEKELTEKLSEKFKKATGVENLIVKVEKLKNADMPSMITVSEQTRRMSEMMEMYGMSNSSTGLGAEGETLVLNMNNDLVQYVLNNVESENTTTICQQLWEYRLMEIAWD